MVMKHSGNFALTFRLLLLLLLTSAVGWNWVAELSVPLFDVQVVRVSLWLVEC